MDSVYRILKDNYILIFLYVFIHCLLKKQILKIFKFFVISNLNVKCNFSFIIITFIVHVIVFINSCFCRYVCVGIVCVYILLAWLENSVLSLFLVSWVVQKELHHFSSFSSSSFLSPLSSLFWVINCLLNPLQENQLLLVLLLLLSWLSQF